MTTGERRAVVTAVQGRYDISERYACRALGFEMLFIPAPLVPAEWRRFVVGPCRFDRPHGNSKAAKPR